MYLIAACLPSLRVIITQLRSTLTTSISSLLQKRRGYDENASVRSSPERENSDKARQASRVDMELASIERLQDIAEVDPDSSPR